MALHCNVFLLDVAQHVCPWMQRTQGMREVRGIEATAAHVIHFFPLVSLSSRRYAVARYTLSADNHTHTRYLPLTDGEITIFVQKW